MNLSRNDRVRMSVLRLAYNAMSKAVRFGRVTERDIAVVKAAVELGVAAPVTPKPFARLELPEVPAGTWPHYLTALEVVDRSALYETRKTVEGDERAAQNRRINFLHFLHSAIKAALGAAIEQFQPEQPKRPEPLTASRLCDMMAKLAKENAALGDLRAHTKACRVAYAFVLQQKGLTTVAREDLIEKIKATAVCAFTRLYGKPHEGYESGLGFMGDLMSRNAPVKAARRQLRPIHLQAKAAPQSRPTPVVVVPPPVAQPTIVEEPMAETPKARLLVTQRRYTDGTSRRLAFARQAFAQAPG